MTKNNTNFELTTTEVTEDEVKQLVQTTDALQDSLVYIAPESSTEGFDLLNYYSADMRKLAKQHNIQCKVITHGNNYKYLDLKDSDVVLPFLISVSASACYDLLKSFITRFFIGNPNKLKINMTVKDKKKSLFKNVKMSGNADDVLKALEILEKDES